MSSFCSFIRFGYKAKKEMKNNSIINSSTFQACDEQEAYKSYYPVNR